jgi:hypothetical protein
MRSCKHRNPTIAGPRASTRTYQRKRQTKDAGGRELDALPELAAYTAPELAGVGLHLARHPANVVDVIKGLVLSKEGVKVLRDEEWAHSNG